MGADAMVGKPEAMTAEDEAQILASIRKWLERDVRPQVKELEHSDEYPHRMVEQMKELGLFGATIPTGYGGLGLSASLYARIVTMIAEVWMSLTGISTRTSSWRRSCSASGRNRRRRTSCPASPAASCGADWR